MIDERMAFTPRETVSELDRYIVGQGKAKRAVAIALRNRWRRQQVPDDLRDEIAPKNIIMIGPTGVGKTEIARRLAKLARAPFVKVEASKFTEVGYVGRDVESMIRDLVEVAIQLVRAEKVEGVQTRAAERAEERVLSLILNKDRPAPAGGTPGKGPAFAVPPGFKGATMFGPFMVTPPPRDGTGQTDASATADAHASVDRGIAEGAAADQRAADRRAEGETDREELRKRLRAGELDDDELDMEVPDNSSPFMTIFGQNGMEEMELNLKEMLGQLPGFKGKTKRRTLKVKDALAILKADEAQRLVDQDAVQQEAIRRTEQTGIVFLDEIDKVAGRQGAGLGPDVSREGVQRDLLPVVEGSTVTTKHGPVKTDHILFIAAGAFHVAKVSDLIPELQGRFPIRVELQSLEKDDFVRILTEPKTALTRQYEALLATEGVELAFAVDAIEAISVYAMEANQRAENIGARRLHTILEALLEELSFTAPERTDAKVTIDEAYVRNALDPILGDAELAKYVL